MAKKTKGNRFLIAFLCKKCNAQNYLSERNKINHPNKLTLKKYCHWCKKKTEHKETTKLK